MPKKSKKQGGLKNSNIKEAPQDYFDMEGSVEKSKKVKQSEVFGKQKTEKKNKKKKSKKKSY
jgi:hypothetical protein